MDWWPFREDRKCPEGQCCENYSLCLIEGTDAESAQMPERNASMNNSKSSLVAVLLSPSSDSVDECLVFLRVVNRPSSRHARESLNVINRCEQDDSCKMQVGHGGMFKPRRSSDHAVCSPVQYVETIACSFTPLVIGCLRGRPRPPRHWVS